MKHAYLLYTGFGKTKLCLDKIVNAKRIPRTLLISTKNVIETAWQREINKWYPQLKYSFITGTIKEDKRLEILNSDYHILGINTEMLDWFISNTTTIKRTANLKQGKKIYYNDTELASVFDLIIVDEVSLFKNSQSKRFKLIKKWCHLTPNVIILSATPTPKNIEDIWSQIYLLDGGERLGKNITAFRERYAIPVPLSNGYTKYEYSIAAVDEVLNEIKDLITSIPKPDKDIFPAPIIVKTLIKPDLKTQEILEKFKQEFVVQLDKTKTLIAFSKMQVINKVNQIASGFVYLQEETIQINNLKLKALQYKLQYINTPVLIPYVYITDKDMLLNNLPGAVLLDNPQAFRDWNNNKIKYGIISPFSAAHGLNLQDSDCENIIWFSPIWDTEKWQQTNARVCRRGQKHKVVINVLLLKGSYDEYAFDLCQTKFNLQYNNLIKLKEGGK